MQLVVLLPRATARRRLPLAVLRWLHLAAVCFDPEPWPLTLDGGEPRRLGLLGPVWAAPWLRHDYMWRARRWRRWRVTIFGRTHWSGGGSGMLGPAGWRAGNACSPVTLLADCTGLACCPWMLSMDGQNGSHTCCPRECGPAGWPSDWSIGLAMAWVGRPALPLVAVTQRACLLPCKLQPCLLALRLVYGLVMAWGELSALPVIAVALKGLACCPRRCGLLCWPCDCYMGLAMAWVRLPALPMIMVALKGLA